MFKFKLQSVLGLKENIEEVKKREFGVANRQKQQIEELKRQLQIKEEDNKLKRMEAQKQEIDVREIQNFTKYSDLLAKRESKLDIKLNKAGQEVEEKRLELIEAMKERKILTHLKEIKKEAFWIEARKEEEKQVDELVSYKYTKRGVDKYANQTIK